MKHLRLFLLLLIVPAALSGVVYAQDEPPPKDVDQAERPADRRPNLFAELGLSPEQLQQIRRINQERRPLMMRAQHRLREANRALDMAIYADTVSDADFQARLSEFRAAQSELARLRFEGELSIRKILSPEQLVRFRELRRRFAENRETKRQNRRFRRGGGHRMGLPPPERPINR